MIVIVGHAGHDQRPIVTDCGPERSNQSFGPRFYGTHLGERRVDEEYRAGLHTNIGEILNEFDL